MFYLVRLARINITSMMTKIIRFHLFQLFNSSKFQELKIQLQKQPARTIRTNEPHSNTSLMAFNFSDQNFVIGADDSRILLKFQAWNYTLITLLRDRTYAESVQRVLNCLVLSDR